ncbi:MAG: putative toxin-antitoxin system toxin component, PIN family [Anaerolineales bacterium]|nr:putative toxin-antitoxin system toxin component, PIN family [Anaerolineales bacterium]
MIRAVVDANVLISGAIVTHGASAFITEAIKRRQFLFITCRRNLRETYRVLGYRRVRRKYRVRDRDRKRLIGRLAFIGEFVEPIGGAQICRDPTDDYLIEMAILGRATHLVTGDEDFHGDPALLRFLQERDVAVIRPADFATLLREHTISGDSS